MFSQEDRDLVANTKSNYLVLKETLDLGNCDYKDLAQEFALILKPFLSKPQMNTLNLTLAKEIDPEIPDIVLNSKHGIYECYKNYDDSTTEKYAKMAVILQYCLAFEKQHNIKDIFNLKQEVNDVEKTFLKLAKKKFKEKSDPNIKEESKKSSLESNKLKVIAFDKAKNRKDQLEKERDNIKLALEKIQKLGIQEISDRAQKTQEMYEKTAKFFVNNSGTGFFKNL